jgi:hypothetical protein
LDYRQRRRGFRIVGSIGFVRDPRHCENFYPFSTGPFQCSRNFVHRRSGGENVVDHDNGASDLTPNLERAGEVCSSFVPAKTCLTWRVSATPQQPTVCGPPESGGDEFCLIETTTAEATRMEWNRHNEVSRKRFAIQTLPQQVTHGSCQRNPVRVLQVVKHLAKYLRER